MTKKFYVVRGSEDGNLGVYSSMRKAKVRARAYLKDGYETGRISLESNSPHYAYYSRGRMIAEIDLFFLNL